MSATAFLLVILIYCARRLYCIKALKGKKNMRFAPSPACSFAYSCLFPPLVIYLVFLFSSLFDPPSIMKSFSPPNDLKTTKLGTSHRISRYSSFSPPLHSFHFLFHVSTFSSICPLFSSMYPRFATFPFLPISPWPAYNHWAHSQLSTVSTPKIHCPIVYVHVLFSIFNSFFSILILSSIISCFSHISFFSYLFFLISLPSHSLLSHFSHHLLSNFPRRPCGSQPLVPAININISSQKPSKISKNPIQSLKISIFSTPTFPSSYLNTLLPLLVYPRYLLPNGAPYLYALPHD